MRSNRVPKCPEVGAQDLAKVVVLVPTVRVRLIGRKGRVLLSTTTTIMVGREEDGTQVLRTMGLNRLGLLNRWHVQATRGKTRTLLNILEAQPTTGSGEDTALLGGPTNEDDRKEERGKIA